MRKEIVIVEDEIEIVQYDEEDYLDCPEYGDFVTEDGKIIRFGEDLFVFPYFQIFS